jgi:hypothetical protein
MKTAYNVLMKKNMIDIGLHEIRENVIPDK